VAPISIRFERFTVSHTSGSAGGHHYKPDLGGINRNFPCHVKYFSSPDPFPVFPPFLNILFDDQRNTQKTKKNWEKLITTNNNE